MPLNASNFVQDGHLTHQDIRQFVELFTGQMNDQPVYLNNTLQIGSYLQVQAMNTPQAPALGYLRIYYKDDGCLWMLDGTGVERSLCNGTGPPGLQGPPGPQGPEGPRGSDGDQGPPGPEGQTGATGPQGEEGPPGMGFYMRGSVPTQSALPGDAEIGDAYFVTDVGHLFIWDGDAWLDVGDIRGPQGPAGATGAPGRDGATGPRGPIGPQGDVGPAGPQGPQGSIGDLADLGLGSTPIATLGWDGNQFVLGQGGGLTLPLGQNLTFAPDNTYDIGVLGANRPRNLYLMGSLSVAGSTTLTGLTTLGNHLLWTTDGQFDIGQWSSNRPRNFYTSGDFWGNNLGARGYYTTTVGASGRRWLLTSDGFQSVGTNLDFSLDTGGGSVWFTGGQRFQPDATYDIGEVAANRPRNLYLSGTAVLGRDPTGPMEAATKQYVDAQVAAGGGGGLTLGDLGLSSTPISPSVAWDGTQFVQGSGGGGGLTLPLNQHLTWVADGFFDIGASGVNRPRDLYLSRNLYIQNNASIGGQANPQNLTQNLLTIIAPFDNLVTGAMLTKTGITVQPTFPDVNTYFGYGIQCLLRSQGTTARTFPNMTCVLADTPVWGAQTTVTNVYGFRINNQASAKVTNAYGVYIYPQVGATGDNVGLWNDGSSKLTQPVTVDRDPTATMEVATKQYVDAQLAGGGGGLTLPLSQHLTFAADNIYDVGTSTNRVRNLYVSNEVWFGQTGTNQTIHVQGRTSVDAATVDVQISAYQDTAYWNNPVGLVLQAFNTNSRVTQITVAPQAGMAEAHLVLLAGWPQTTSTNFLRLFATSAGAGIGTGASSTWQMTVGNSTMLRLTSQHLAILGHIGMQQDNQFDIGIATPQGASLLNRPRDLFLARNFRQPTDGTATAELGRVGIMGGTDLLYALRVNGDTFFNGDISFVNMSTLGSGNFGGPVTAQYFSTGGTAVLGRDPQAAMEAATKQYVDAHAGGDGGPSAPATGTIFLWSGATAPTGALLCDGAAVDRSAYAALFAVIGTTYGAGNGSTTFNVPDCRGRALIGSNATYARGSVGGAATVTLSVANLAAHNHTGSDGGHTHGVSSVSHNHSVNDPTHNHTINQSGHSHGDPSHTHGISQSGHQHGRSGFNKQSGGESSPQGITSDSGGIWSSGANANISINGAYAGLQAANATVSNAASGTGVTTANANGAAATTGTGYGSISTGNNGSGTAHENMPPYLAVNYCIQT